VSKRKTDQAQKMLLRKVRSNQGGCITLEGLVAHSEFSEQWTRQMINALIGDGCLNLGRAEWFNREVYTLKITDAGRTALAAEGGESDENKT
jgi:hypothetical protein